MGCETEKWFNINIQISVLMTQGLSCEMTSVTVCEQPQYPEHQLLTETRTAWYYDGISENICCTYSQTQVICIEELYFYLYFFFVSSVILNLRLDITIYVQCITQLYFMYISHLYSSIINSIIILLYSNMYVYLCCFKVISPPHTHTKYKL